MRRFVFYFNQRTQALGDSLVYTLGNLEQACDVLSLRQTRMTRSRNFKGGIGCRFEPYVNAMGGGHIDRHV